MASHSFVTRHCEAVQRHVHNYYPYGGVIGDISTNESLQKYKLFHYIPREQARSEGKELDRTFGLDNYDIHARQYFAMMPMWDKPDSKAEDYYPISPYSYCGGDPVNKGDYNGKAIIFVNGFRIGVGCRDQVRYGYGDNSYPSVYKEDVAKYWDNEIFSSI